MPHRITARTGYALAAFVLAATRAAAQTATPTTPARSTSPSSAARDSASARSPREREALPVRKAIPRSAADGSGAVTTPFVPPLPYAPPPAPAPEPIPVASLKTDSTPSVPTTYDDEPRRYGNGVYLGVQGGASFPQRAINDAYRTGVSGGLQLGVDPRWSPLGVRVNALYHRLQGDAPRSLLRPRADDAELYSAFVDATARLPFGSYRGATSGVYLVAGPGVALFRHYVDFRRQSGLSGDPAAVVGPESSTRLALNGGAGVEVGARRGALFAEGRYVRALRPGRDVDYVPVTIGVRVHSW